jgi:hypothetical protein
MKSRAIFPLIVGISLLAPIGPTATAAPTAPVVVGAGVTTSNLSQYPLGTASFVADRLYIAFLKLSEAGGIVDKTPGIVGAGTAWIQIDGGQASTGSMGLAAYRFVPSVDTTAVALTTDTLSTRHEGLAYSILEVTGGFDRTTPIAQHRAAASSPALGYSISLPAAPAADSLVVASFAHAANEGSTPNAGWTEVAGSDLTHTSPSQANHVIFDDVAPSGTPGSSWITSARRRGLAIEIPSDDGTAPTGVTLVAAADICGSLTACKNTSDRVIDTDPDVVMTMGDHAYPNGTLTQFRDKYCGSYPNCSRWGREAIQSITLPGYGNHDCFDVPRDTGATKQGCDGAVAYFGPDSNFGTDIPGLPGSYYTVKGEWLIVQLNSAGNEGTGAATVAEIESQDQALKAVLSADDHTCEIVAWHHARFASGDHGNNLFTDPWFETVYAQGVDVVLNGHAHSYERFLPQDGDGQQVADGVTEFVVGTGGASIDAQFGAIQPNSAARFLDFGVLSLDLNDDGTYSWAFLDDLTAEVDDQGSGNCHP